MRIFTYIVLCLAAYGHAVQAQAGPECRTAALPDGTPALFCKDKKGNWQQQQGKVAVAPAALPTSAAQQLLYADARYRGSVVYVYPIEERRRRNTGIIDALVSAAASNTRREEILASITMRIEGEVVTGTITGGVWTNNVPITGTRRNGICDISATLNGDSVVYKGKCDASGFSGTATQYPRRGTSTKGTFQLAAISFTDTSTRDSRRADLEAKCDGGSGSVEACVELDQLK
ncbi:hypothetical protein ACFOON_12545 [Novosphingobium piscinae]|uniref:Uncharacterized protein n=1 Tax=Novosphingobium piscinae TaxID=1507448 RepID=A0A7X1FX40_9SPHN|nr:hypothetical protein [Novosphingobium piscinae]MBC2667957.1 hypothetical protein [Novosphingobium piscinae]